MSQNRWLTAKDVLRVNAFKWANKTGVKDLNKSFTFKEWNERSCRLANALADLGMKKGDRFAVLAYNCVEWMEVYARGGEGRFRLCAAYVQAGGARNGIHREPL